MLKKTINKGAVRCTLFSVLCALCSVLTSCSDESEAPQPVPTADALAQLPAHTPVSVRAELNVESRTADEAAVWYAAGEIHAALAATDYQLHMPGGTSKQLLQATTSLDNLAATDPFSTLMLKDFNLVEGDERNVSRWTCLHAQLNATDHLMGFARLQADEQGNPVLSYGELQRASAKVTIVLQDEQGAPVAADNGKITATLSLPGKDIVPVYAPAGEAHPAILSQHLAGVTTLQADEAIDPEAFGWAVLGSDENRQYALTPLVKADGSEEVYLGEGNNLLSAIVLPTPTHTETLADGQTLLTPVDAPAFTDLEVLTITVNTDPDGEEGPQTTGTYTLKLKDIVLKEGDAESNLTAFQSGKHYTLTLTLKHNLLLDASATLGSWSSKKISFALEDDAKLPPYEYNAETKTYTVFEEEYVKPVWNMKNADDKVMYNDMLVVDGSASTDAIYSVISGAITDGIKSYYVINQLMDYEEEFYIVPYTLSAAIFYLVYVDEGGTPREPNDPDIGSLSIVLADLTTIPDGTFNYCAALKSVSAPMATSVGNSTFMACKGLEKVTLDAATTIGDMAFFDCTNLKELTFGGVITEIGEMAFATWGSSNTPWTLNCDLTLASGQTVGEPNVEAKTWAGYTWKSITISNNP